MELVRYIVLECIDGSLSIFFPSWYIHCSEPLSQFFDSEYECTVGVYFASY